MGGGGNKTHGQIEKFQKLDSFRVSGIDGAFTVRWPSGGSIRIEATPDIMQLLYRYRGEAIREPVRMSTVPNNYGGARSFFLCPGCGRRVRFLYLRWGRFRCRSCARLNYRSQQATKDEFYPYDAAVKLLRDRFRVPEEQIPVPMDLPYFIPERPRGMRWATYWALLEKYGAHRKRYSCTMIRRVEAILKHL
ncbi:MAG: hypothetical protein SO072_12305 [Dysosmobacter sp.]|nr:hypothetical protein [Dysosmobacter sp.]